MKKSLKKLNSLSKSKQMFIIMLLFGAIIGIFCMAGCGEKDCETPSYDSVEVGDGEVSVCSLPGCGGCLTSGEGCGCALWPQSIKYVSLTEDASYLKGCDVRYYTKQNCLGCVYYTEDSCYYGCANFENGKKKMSGIFFGSTDSGEGTFSENVIGCDDGCVSCGSGSLYNSPVIHRVESYVGE